MKTVREYNDGVYIVNLVTRLISIWGRDYRYCNIADIANIINIVNIANIIKETGRRNIVEMGRCIGVIEVSCNNIFIKLIIGTIEKAVILLVIYYNIVSKEFLKGFRANYKANYIIIEKRLDG